MSVLAWVALGLIAGFVASNIFSRSGQGLLLDLVLGIVGAIVGGYLFAAIGATGITGFNLYSMLVAIRRHRRALGLSTPSGAAHF